MEQVYPAGMIMAQTSSEKTGYRKRPRRVVAKFGTSLLTGGSDHLDQDMMSDLVTQVAKLKRQGNEILVVASPSSRYWPR